MAVFVFVVLLKIIMIMGRKVSSICIIKYFLLFLLFQEKDFSKEIAAKQLQIKYLNVYNHKREWPHIFTELNKFLLEVSNIFN